MNNNNSGDYNIPVLGTMTVPTEATTITLTVSRYLAGVDHYDEHLCLHVPLQLLENHDQQKDQE